MLISLTLPTLTTNDRADVATFLHTRVCRETFLSSPAGQATQQIAEAIRLNQAAPALDLTRTQWSGVFRALGNGGRAATNATAEALVNLATQINTADRAANPTLPALVNS